MDIGSLMGLLVFLAVWFGCKALFNESFKKKVSEAWVAMMFIPAAGLLVYLFFSMFELGLVVTSVTQ